MYSATKILLETLNTKIFVWGNTIFWRIWFVSIKNNWIVIGPYKSFTDDEFISFPASPSDHNYCEIYFRCVKNPWFGGNVAVFHLLSHQISKLMNASLSILTVTHTCMGKKFSTKAKYSPIQHNNYNVYKFNDNQVKLKLNLYPGTRKPHQFSA